MAKDTKKNDSNLSKADTLADGKKSYLFQDLFAAPVKEELNAKEIFTGDKAFYDSLQTDSPRQTPQPIPPTSAPVPSTPEQYKRFSLTQKFLAAAIIIIASAMVYSLLKSPQTHISQMHQPIATPQTAAQPQNADQDIKPPAPHEKEVQQKLTDSDQPVSLTTAQELFTDEKYPQAYEIYYQLSLDLARIPEEKLMSDFLGLQMARCCEKTGDLQKAANLYKKISSSNSPALRLMACYRSSTLEMQKKQFLSARTKAWQGVALADAIDHDPKWALEIKRNCSFLAAQALTSQILSLSDADKDLPEQLWQSPEISNDPFVSLDQENLRKLLTDGSEKLKKAILAPTIQNLDNSETIKRYDVICNKSAVDELLARFSSKSKLELCWNLDNDEIGIRKRMVYLYMPSVTDRQFATVAAGATGLLASIDQENVINIYNPAKYNYISQHLFLLTEQSISLWRNFMLRFPDDARLANIHFALGLLYQQNQQPYEAVGEYKLLANKFARSPLAAYALMNSSQLKTSMHDYAGGKSDLKQLVEQYPDATINEIAYLYLASATVQTGQFAQAAKLYKKAYNLTFNPQFQIQAAIGAGKCFYKMNDYTSAEIWLSRHLLACRENKTKASYQTYILLGKTFQALNKIDKACGAFQMALKTGTAKISKEEHLETIFALVDNYMLEQKFIEALNTVENIFTGTLSNEENVQLLLLKSRIYRNMHLYDKALALLADKAEYMTDLQLKANILYELSHCYLAQQNLDLAYENLSKALVIAKSQSLMHQIALDLAEVCLKQERHSQAIFVCSELLDMNPERQIRQNAVRLLADAYKQQKDYDNAALALLGKWKLE